MAADRSAHDPLPDHKKHSSKIKSGKAYSHSRGRGESSDATQPLPDTGAGRGSDFTAAVCVAGVDKVKRSILLAHAA